MWGNVFSEHSLIDFLLDDNKFILRNITLNHILQCSTSRYRCAVQILSERLPRRRRRRRSDSPNNGKTETKHTNRCTFCNKPLKPAFKLLS